MKTLIATQNQYYLPITKQKFPIHSHKNINKISQLRKSTWKLHAEAKGFGDVPAETQKQNGRVDASKRRKNKKNDDNDDKIPAAVWERILTRILIYVGAPLVSGFVFLQVFSIVKENQLWDVPIWLPFLTTFITFGASALGVAYGTLSASWDPEKQGSFLGLEEAQKNWVDMWSEDGDDEEENRWTN